jgi:predicted DNA-binding transcriptional regulator YafY
MLTDAEAVALTLGLLAIREFRFPVEAAAVEGALAKAERVMPTPLLQQVRSLQDAITFRFSAPPFTLDVDVVVTLSVAVEQRRRVHLHYRSGSSDTTQRDVDPYGIVFNDGTWYTAGYCHMRQDVRTFRLDRIIKAEPRDQTFERPEGFDVVGRVMGSLAHVAGAQDVEVVLATSLEHAQRIIPPNKGTLEAVPEGVLYRRTTSQLEWIAQMLLSLDVPAHVIKPLELRTLLRTIAERALRIADS